MDNGSDGVEVVIDNGSEDVEMAIGNDDYFK